MNSKIVVGIAAVALALGAAAYFVTKKAMQPEVQGEKIEENQETEAPAAQSLQELLSSGQTKVCQFTDIMDSGKTEGETFIGNAKIRVNFTVTENAGATTGHAIVDGQTSYVWVEGMPMGFKFARGTQSAGNPAGDLLDENKKLDYNCADWSVDNSQFELPAGVKFTDINTMMQ